MEEFTITVNSSNRSLYVSNPVVQILPNQTAKITWVPGSGNLHIRFVGFYQPTAQSVSPLSGPVTSPAPTVEEPSNWACTVENNNTHEFTEYFYYTVYAEVDGVTLCTDPEIQNQGPSGG